MTEIAIWGTLLGVNLMLLVSNTFMYFVLKTKIRELRGAAETLKTQTREAWRLSEEFQIAYREFRKEIDPHINGSSGEVRH